MPAGHRSGHRAPNDGGDRAKQPKILARAPARELLTCGTIWVMAENFPRPTPENVIARNSELCPTMPGTTAGNIIVLSSMTEGAGSDIDTLLPFYLAIVCPERPSFIDQKIYRNQADWEAMSGCALVARSHLRRAGVRHPSLGLDVGDVKRPYRPQSAVANIEEVGRSMGALRGPDELPVPGAIGVVDPGNPHVVTFHEVSDREAITIDGGLPGIKKSTQMILRRRYAVGRVGRKWAFSGRVLIHWLDPEKLQISAPPTTEYV